MDDPESDFSDWPGSAPWQPLADAALPCFMLTSVSTAAVVGVAAGPVPALAFGLAQGLAWYHAAWAIGVPVAAVLLGVLRAWLAFRYTRWRLDEDGLRVRRGRFWRSETLVPRARVQHLDINRGPIERRFGLATLVAHTAGTRTSALVQAGFDEDSAMRLRDALVPQDREHDDANA